MDNSSRFFRSDDPRSDRFFFDLPPHWWSRPYEYLWASQFVDCEQVVLDAACGICHPFKFYLLDHSKAIEACDIDGRILVADEILGDIAAVFGDDVARSLPIRYLENIGFSKASLSSLPYANGTFDRVFCISVLEHLNDAYNRYPRLWNIPIVRRILRRDIYDALGEFKRVLKNDGLMVLTFDFPRINLHYLKMAIRDQGLLFSGPVTFDIPDNALYNAEKRLLCFGAILQKGNPISLSRS